MNESLVLARLRHASGADPCPQFGVDRTQRLDTSWALMTHLRHALSRPEKCDELVISSNQLSPNPGRKRLRSFKYGTNKRLDRGDCK
jgi:hypothetical protein